MMEKTIKDQIKDDDYSAVQEIIIDNVKSRQIDDNSKKILEKLKNLQVLSLNNINLTTLANFPNVASLKMLELSDNHLETGLEALAQYPELISLNLSNNKVASLDELQKLGKLSKLCSLDLFYNPVMKSSEKEVKEWVWATFPQLQTLDGLDKDGKEVYDSHIDDEEEMDNLDEFNEEAFDEGEGDEEEGEEEKNADGTPSKKKRHD